MIKAVIFDVDGVMLDSEPYFAAGRRHILDKNGLVARQRHARVLAVRACA